MSGFLPPRRDYIVNRLFSKYTDELMGINSTSFASGMVFSLNLIDLTLFPATHFRLWGRASANEAAESITFQLATSAVPHVAPWTAAHTGAGDVTITDTSSVLFDSGWLTRDDGLTGDQLYLVTAKGSTATVDLNLRSLELHWKIA